MKHTFSLFFATWMLLMMTACSFTSAVTPAPPNPTTESVLALATETPLSSPTSIPSLTHLPLTRTPTSIPPTETLSPTVSPTPTHPSGNISATRIQFAAGGTWTELVATGQANQSIGFALGAAQGQVMSVSVFEGPGYILTITGADGTLLTPPDSAAYFWRGILPATQDYFVSVLAPNDGNFTLRVAINPPGQSEQTFNYANTQYGLSLEYSDSFAPVKYTYAFLQGGDPALALNVQDMDFYFNTNLLEAFFVLNMFNKPDTMSNCYEEVQVEGQATFNGITFDKSTEIDAAAGNIYELISYHTMQKNVCIGVVFFMHYANIGVFTPGTVTEFDREGLIQRFEAILGTLTIQ